MKSINEQLVSIHPSLTVELVDEFCKLHNISTLSSLSTESPACIGAMVDDISFACEMQEEEIEDGSPFLQFGSWFELKLEQMEDDMTEETTDITNTPTTNNNTETTVNEETVTSATAAPTTTYAIDDKLSELDSRLNLEVLNEFHVEKLPNVDLRTFAGPIHNMIFGHVKAYFEGEAHPDVWEGLREWLEVKFAPPEPEVVPTPTPAVEPTPAPAPVTAVELQLTTTMERISQQYQACAAMGIHLPEFTGYGNEGDERTAAQREVYETRRKAHDEMPTLSSQCQTVIGMIADEQRKDYSTTLGQLRFLVDDNGKLRVVVLTEDGELNLLIEYTAFISLVAAAKEGNGNSLLPTSLRELRGWTARQIASHGNLRIEERSITLNRKIMLRTRIDKDGNRSLFSFAGPTFSPCDADQVALAVMMSLPNEIGQFNYNPRSLDWKWTATRMLETPPVNGEVFQTVLRGYGRDVYGTPGSSPKTDAGVRRQRCNNDMMLEEVRTPTQYRCRVGMVVSRVQSDIVALHAGLEEHLPQFQRQWDDMANVPLIKSVTESEVEGEEPIVGPGVFHPSTVESYKQQSATRRRMPEQINDLQAAVELALTTVSAGKDIKDAVHRDSIVAMMLNENTDLSDVNHVSIADLVNGITRHHRDDESQRVLVRVGRNKVEQAKPLGMLELANLEKAALPFGRQLMSRARR